MYYDTRGRVVQTRATNHLGGYDIAYNEYNHSGLVTKNLKEHNIAGQATISETYTNEYDHANRLLKTKYQINDKPEIVLVDNSASDAYDELGRLRKKKRHDGVDTEEFDYNIRNWATRIKSGDFEERLYYASNPLNKNLCYNGNISYNTWTYNGILKGYAYTYDQLNRLRVSNYAENHAIDDEFNSNYEAFKYDKMGNITELLRYESQGFTIDDLRYTYNGNKLKNVNDLNGARDIYSLKEYQNKAQNGYNTSVEEMAYDANGNLIKDLDRDIVTIKYNLLNLPEVIQFKNGNQIRNLYDASGQKLNSRNVSIAYSTIHPIISIGEIYNWSDLIGDNEEVYIDGDDYVGNCEYGFYDEYYQGEQNMNGIYLKQVNNPEGYYDLTYGDAFFYYCRRDHLGNNREVWRAPFSSGNTNYPAATIQRTQYYPSGLPWTSNTGDNPSWQNKKYNGKEFVEMHGLDEYDSQARWYQPAIMRTTTIDPLAEKYYSISPYAWCGGNPVRMVDPTGMDIWEVNNKGEVVNQIEDKTQDTFYMLSEDKDGNYQRTYKTDEDGNKIFNSISFEYGTITKSEKEGLFNSATSYSVKDESSGSSLFKFFADNTKVEFGLINTQNNGSVVMTNHKEGSVNASLAAMRMSEDGKTVTSIVHNHPNNFGPSGFYKNDKTGDKYAANLLINSHGYQVERYVYRSKSNSLTMYDNKTYKIGEFSWNKIFQPSKSQNIQMRISYPGKGLKPR